MILWANLFADIPPAMALGVDPAVSFAEYRVLPLCVVKYFLCLDLSLHVCCVMATCLPFPLWFRSIMVLNFCAGTQCTEAPSSRSRCWSIQHLDRSDCPVSRHAVLLLFVFDY